MKILFWLFIGFDKHGTSEHLLVSVIHQLCVAGHDVHILQKYTGGDLPPIPECLDQHSVTSDIVPFKAADKGNFAARYLKELKYVKSCKKYIKEGYDAVFIQSNTVAGFAVKAIRKKLPEAIITFNVQDIFPYNAVYSGKIKEKSGLFRILAGIQRYGYKHSDHIITISEDMKDTLIGDGVDKDKIVVIYNWSYQDDPYENVDLSPVKHMFSNDYFNVVYAGNIGVMQNVEIVIEVARIMNDENVWFHIIGDGQYKKNLEKKAQEYGIKNLSFWPMLPSEYAPAVYSSADINIIPLVKNVYRTALPSKTATCLACQKPCIFVVGEKSKFGSFLIQETSCSVTDTDDTEKIVKEIQRLKKCKTCLYPDGFFAKYFSVSENSKKYADIIVGKQ